MFSEISMNGSFPKTHNYITSLDMTHCDELDQVTKELMENEAGYERASQALRRRFIEGVDGSWSEPQERIWVVSMFALWQRKRRITR